MKTTFLVSLGWSYCITYGWQPSIVSFHAHQSRLFTSLYQDLNHLIENIYN